MMAESAQLDILRIPSEAQHRWLRPAEICEILRNYDKFHISPEPPSRPPSGSLFLFNRKVLRHFRKDGHNWSKKPDGKTMKEGHEKFKAGSIDVLNCYYAHGEENRNFQRRSYWMLEEDLSHIAFVHYLEVKGNRTNFKRRRDADGIPASRQNDEDISNSEVDIPELSRFQPYDYQRAPPVTDATNLNNTQASEHEDAASAHRHQACPGFQSIHELQSPAMQNMDDGSIPYHPAPGSNNYQGQSSAIPGMSFGSITQGEENKNTRDSGLTNELQRDHEFPSLPSTESTSMSMMPGQDNDQVFSCSFGKKQGFGSYSDGLEESQASDRDPPHVSKRSMDQKSDRNLDLVQNPHCPSLRQPLLNDLPTELSEINQVEQGDSMVLHNTHLTDQSRQPMQHDLQFQALNAVGSSLESEPDGNLNTEDKTNYSALRQQPLLDGVMPEGLKKQDSFHHWMIEELGDVTESTIQPGSGFYWETVGSEDGDDSGISTQVPLGNYIHFPPLPEDQLFSITDLSTDWAYSGSKIKVLVMGKFLRSKEELENNKWACMFGGLEVPAQIAGDGVLQCHTPSHETARVPFYITCSNRLACSEVREFEFRTSSVEDVDSDEILFHMGFTKQLSLLIASYMDMIEAKFASLMFG